MDAIYIVNQSAQLQYPIAEIIAALQEQVSRDFAPLWGIKTTIKESDQVAVSRSGVPAIYLVDTDAGTTNLGYHIDTNNIPSAFVSVPTCRQYSVPETTAVSHELLEMLADPTCTRMVSQYLVEVCDAVTQDYYMIGDIPVNNFCTPRYYGYTNIGHFDQMDRLQAGIPSLSYGGMIMWYDGTKWNQTFARTDTGALTWRAHTNGRNTHRANTTPAS